MDAHTQYRRTDVMQADETPNEQPATDAGAAVAQVKAGAAPATPAAPAAPAKPAVSYSMSPGFVGLLNRLNLSVAISSYQSGRVYLLGRNPRGGLMVNEQYFQKAMGISGGDDGFLLATQFQILEFRNVLREKERAEEVFEKVYVPRQSHVTGVLDAHDVGRLTDGRPVFVNTRFNCLATPHPVHSFEEYWRPSFVSALVSEDRCHLNGMAMADGAPAYVTAVSKSDTIDGWRDRRSDGGVLIDVARNEIVCEGLSMPHSPRVHNGKVWLLNSGEGELGYFDPSAPELGFQPQIFCPGFLRGLALRDGHAFVGLSKPRYKRFEGLGLDARLAKSDSAPWCGVQVINLAKKSVAEWFRIDGAVSELYDVAVLPGAVCPMLLGFASPELRNLVTY
ncbi:MULTISPECIES: TIGR03032 family protein [unclassified Marinovum]